MLFGLLNAGATYQRAMTAIFHDMMHEELEDYVDDIVVKSKQRKDHVEVLRRVLQRCREDKLKMHPMKCAFGVTSGKFFGYLVNRQGPAKAKAVLYMPLSERVEVIFCFRKSFLFEKVLTRVSSLIGPSFLWNC